MNQTNLNNYGVTDVVTQEDRFLEVRDIFVSALRRISQTKESAQIADNELDKSSHKSVTKRSSVNLQEHVTKTSSENEFLGEFRH